MEHTVQEGKYSWKSKGPSTEAVEALRKESCIRSRQGARAAFGKRGPLDEWVFCSLQKEGRSNDSEGCGRAGEKHPFPCKAFLLPSQTLAPRYSAFLRPLISEDTSVIHFSNLCISDKFCLTGSEVWLCWLVPATPLRTTLRSNTVPLWGGSVFSFKIPYRHAQLWEMTVAGYLGVWPNIKP